MQNLNADLQRFINSSELPEVLLSVCYNANLARLTVNVVEGKFFKVKQQYLLFTLPVVGLTGLKSGTGEPVLGHKKYEIVSLVVNDYFIG